MMDKRIFGDLDSLTVEDKKKMSAMIDQLQARDRCMDIVIDLVYPLKQNYSLRMYNALVERCFVDCVDTFYRRSLTKKEETCVHRCQQKFFRHSVLLGLNFAELSQGATTSD